MSDAPVACALIYYLLAPAAYLLGSVPAGIVVSRALGKQDPRESGSGNIGATNVVRTSGKFAGILTLLGDVFKGALPAFLALWLCPEPVFVSIVSLAAFLGHVFPIYLKFKGGKGVATALGVMAVIAPLATALSACAFVIVVLLKRFVSLGSIISAALLPVFIIYFGSRAYALLGAVIAAIVIIKHKDNIKRLVAGKENRLF